MNFLTRFFKSRPDLEKGYEDSLSKLNFAILIQPSFSEAGVVFTLNESFQIETNNDLMHFATSPDVGSLQLIYLAQLVADNLASIRQNSVLIEWKAAYSIISDVEHESSIHLLKLPEIDRSHPVLGEIGTVSDSFFRLQLIGWRNIDGSKITHRSLVGGVLGANTSARLMTVAAWELLSYLTIEKGFEDQSRTQYANEKLWGHARLLAIKARSELSPYLSSTIVLVPSLLKMRYTRAQALGTSVVIVEPFFDESPDGWMQKFDSLKFIPEHADFPTATGRTRVIFPESVRDVLTVMKNEFPGRRVSGSKAEAFLRNPFAYLGESASKVLDEKQIEEAKEEAGIFSTRIAIFPNVSGSQIQSINATVFQTSNEGASKADRVLLSSKHDFELLLSAIENALNQELQFFTWNNFVIDVDGDLYQTLDQGRCWLHVWAGQSEKFIDFTDIYSANYAERVEGIGVAKPIYSVYIKKEGGDESSWSPNPLIGVSLVPGSSPVFIAADADWLNEFEANIERCKVTNASKVVDSRLPIPLTIEEAIALVGQVRFMLGVTAESGRTDAGGGGVMGDPPPGGVIGNPPTIGGPTTPGGGKTQPPGIGDPPVPPSFGKTKKETLLLKVNISKLDYSETEEESARELVLKVPEGFKPLLPKNLKEGVKLKKHQLDGLAWMQYLFSNSPHHCRGALLADDMGLGKTLQLLCLLSWHYEKNPDAPPSLIVAPPVLMQNWQNEAKNFFSEFPEILLLHADGLNKRKQPKEFIDKSLLEKKIANLLVPNWLGSTKIVLTTYETIRDYEFSLAKQDFDFMICDEAQKIKTPNAQATTAAKKQKSKFRIACTGTPVENSLADLWCLFDFIQPGLLGALDEFGRSYRRPIEAKEAGDSKSIEAISDLRSIISPQILRRMKSDSSIALDLPQKIIVSNTDYEFAGSSRRRLAIPISNHQRNLYVQGLRQIEAINNEKDAKKRSNVSFAVLHFVRALCSEPYCLPKSTFAIDVGGHNQHLTNAPKLKWLLDTLEEISKKSEKVIIFTDIKEIQRSLALFIRKRFDLSVQIINGDIDDRQNLIDDFQQKNGFSAIILSPLAVGFGVNIVAANHVIHFTRTWNPAKEGQATDRAYRIGQTKDVNVYCPTVIASDFVTFDEKLDRLMTLKMDLAGDMLDGVGSDISGSALMPDSGPFGVTLDLNKIVDIHRVDTLDGATFEVFCVMLFGAYPNKSYITPKQKGDGGVDFVVIGNDKRGLIGQCKFTTQEVLGWDAVKEVAAGSPAYQMKHPGIYFEKVAVTNKRFNSTAIEQAHILGVKLIDRGELIRLLEMSRIKEIALDEAIFKNYAI
jgi:hypothetical protein